MSLANLGGYRRTVNIVIFFTDEFDKGRCIVFEFVCGRFGDVNVCKLVFVTVFTLARSVSIHYMADVHE